MKEGIVYFARKSIDRQKAALLDLQARQRNSLMRTVATPAADSGAERILPSLQVSFKGRSGTS